MKINLSDVTFLILVRLDSIQRLENTLIVTERLTHYFNTNIVLREACDYKNRILQSLLKRNVKYQFVEDKDPVLHKTRHYNQMLASISTPYVSVWDADIVPDKNAIIESTNQLRSRKADVVYPYNGICFDISDIIRKYYLQKKDIRFLFRNINKLTKLYDKPLVGGALFVDREKYILTGGENETHYGWGNDDFDRYYRFVGFGYRIYRVNKPLFHLTHPRGDNSQYQSSLSMQISLMQRDIIEKSSKEEILQYIVSTRATTP